MSHRDHLSMSFVTLDFSASASRTNSRPPGLGASSGTVRMGNFLLLSLPKSHIFTDSGIVLVEGAVVDDGAETSTSSQSEKSLQSV